MLLKPGQFLPVFQTFNQFASRIFLFCYLVTKYVVFLAERAEAPYVFLLSCQSSLPPRFSSHAALYFPGNADSGKVSRCHTHPTLFMLRSS